MNQKLFELKINDDSLYGIIHQPLYDQKMKKCIVFLHGNMGYRTGPHDMFSKFAEYLSGINIYSILFDFRGNGYSGKFKSNYKLNDKIEDLDAVVEFVKSEFNPFSISFLGICAGAKIGIYYALKYNKKIDFIIELSCPPLRYNDAKNELVRKRFLCNLKFYLSKLKHIETWRKIYNHEIYYKHILHNIIRELTPLLRKTSLTSTHKTLYESNTDLQSVLMIHASKDPEARISINQLSLLLNKYKVSNSVCIIDGANHSFYSIEWERQIWDIVENWLIEKYT